MCKQILFVFAITFCAHMHGEFSILKPFIGMYGYIAYYSSLCVQKIRFACGSSSIFDNKDFRNTLAVMQWEKIKGHIQIS